MQQSETNVIMTPELRNEIIREIIDLIIDDEYVGICYCIYYVLERKRYLDFLDDRERFAYLNIPYIFSPIAPHWPIEDRKSRISFLKAQITC